MSLPDIYPPIIGDEACFVDFQPLIELYGDPDNALCVYLHALGAMLQQVDDIAQDGPGDEPGWSQIFDLVRAKTEWLPWMGQLVGYAVPIQPDDQTLEEYDARQRERIVTRSSERRGTPDLLLEIIQEQLNPPQRVIIWERYDGNAFWIKVWVYSDDIATSEAEVRQAAYAQKVAGLLMDFRLLSTANENYDMLLAEQQTYQVVKDKFANYQEVKDDPGKA